MKAYRLVRTTPEGVEKVHGPVDTVRKAATSAALSLFDNRHATKAEAQRFSVALSRAPLGETVRHESGCTFRIEAA